MKSFITLLAVQLLSVLLIGQNTFQKTININAAGGGSPSIITGKTAVKQTVDGGYVMVGSTSLGVGGVDIVLIKTEADGDISWIKTYGGSADNEYAHDVIQSSDGGYVVVGKSYSFGNGWYDAYIVKTDANGIHQWSKAVGGAQNDLIRSIQETTDGGFICVGETSNFGSGGLDIYLIKFDASGNTVFTKTYGDVGTEYGYSVKQTNDDGYIIAGYTGSFGVDFWDMYLLKTDSTGTLQWGETFGAAFGSSDERGFGVTQTSDSGFVMVGYSSNMGTAGSWDVYMVKTDFSGNLQWGKTYGGSGIDIGNDVQETANGDLIVTGQGSFGLGNLTFRTDNLGNVIWAQEYGSGFGHAYSIQETSDSGFAITGRAGSSFFLVKANSTGLSDCAENALSLSSFSPVTTVTVGGNTSSGGANVVTTTQITNPLYTDTVHCSVITSIETGEKLNEVNLYPNPANDKLIISRITDEPSELIIFNLLGEMVFQRELNVKEVIINTANLPQGIFMVQIKSRQTKRTYKLLITH